MKTGRVLAELLAIYVSDADEMTDLAEIPSLAGSPVAIKLHRARGRLIELGRLDRGTAISNGRSSGSDLTGNRPDWVGAGAEVRYLPTIAKDIARIHIHCLSSRARPGRLRRHGKGS